MTPTKTRLAPLGTTISQVLYMIKSVQVAHLSLNDFCISVLTTDYAIDVSVEPTPVKMLIHLEDSSCFVLQVFSAKQCLFSGHLLSYINYNVMYSKFV